MVISPTPTYLFLLFLFTLSLFISIPTAQSELESESELVAELLTLQSESKTEVTHLDDRTVAKFLTSTQTPRLYSLFIFFDTTQLHDKSELHLPELHREFALVTSSFITNHKYSNSKSLKDDSKPLLRVNSFPYICLVDPNAKSLKDKSEQKDHGSRLFESMAEFLESRTKLTMEDVYPINICYWWCWCSVFYPSIWWKLKDHPKLPNEGFWMLFFTHQGKGAWEKVTNRDWSNLSVRRE